MARKRTRSKVHPKNDTRQKSTPQGEHEQTQAARAEIKSELLAELERLRLTGALIRRNVRQAIAPIGSPESRRFFMRDFEHGFNPSARTDPNHPFGQTPEDTPELTQLTHEILIYPAPLDRAAAGVGGKEEKKDGQQQQKPPTSAKKNKSK